MVVGVKVLLSYRRVRGFCVPLAGALLLVGCWGWIPEDPAPPGPVSAPAEPVEAAPVGGGGRPRPAPVPQTYLVVAGDTLFSIAWRFRLKVADLASWNRLGDGSLILAGQRLRLTPPADQGGASGASAGSGAASRAAASSDAAPARGAAEKTSADSASRAAPAKTGASRQSSAGSASVKTGASRQAPAAGAWRWPAQGRVDAKSARSRAGDYGVRIMGRRGQEVTAAGGGTVMYAGDGLKAYGLLVIVQHSPEWLSAYGHNERILVKEGEQVRAGQPIAAMGVGPGNTAMVHFEIRRDGKPVEPLALLPPRN